MSRPASALTARLDVTQLPSLPHVLLELLDACNSSEPDFAAIAAIVAKDTALSAKLFGLVSSPAYPRMTRVEGVEPLIATIGVDAIRSIAVSASVYHVFSQLGASTLHDLKRFWRHALMSAELARRIAQKISYPQPEEAYLAGLLHDIGRLLLWVNFPREYASIMLDDVDESRVVINGDYNGPVHHAEIGAWLIDHWNLPSLMADAVRYHHEPGERLLDAHELIKITHLANQLSQESTFSGTVPLNDAALLFGFGNDDLAELLTGGLKALTESQRGFEIDFTLEPEETDEGKERRRFRAELRNGGVEPGGDAAKKLQLAREVRDIALYESIRVNLEDAHTLDEILSALQQCMRILAGVPNATFFMFDVQRHGLRGKAIGDQNPILEQLFVPLDGNKSLLSAALVARAPRHSYQNEPVSGLFDDQLLRLLGRDGMFCLPLLAGPRMFGVMVYGIERNQLQRLEKQLKLLTLFAGEAARKLDARTAQAEISGEQESLKLVESQARARRIAHEINNPLAIMKNYLAALQSRLGDDAAIEDEFRIVSEEIDRIGTMVRSLVAPSEPAADLGEGVDVNALISATVKLMEHALRQQQITLIADLSESLAKIATDRSKLKQILLNLIKNAAEAMSRGGEITVTTRDNINQDGQLFIEIEVADNGPGIPAEVMAQLFEPVRTSKGGQHAGLGLAIVKSLVKQMKGHIDCRSGIHGTRMRILLPHTARSGGAGPAHASN